MFLLLHYPRMPQGCMVRPGNLPWCRCPRGASGHCGAGLPLGLLSASLGPGFGLALPLCLDACLGPACLGTLLRLFPPGCEGCDPSWGCCTPAADRDTRCFSYIFKEILIFSPKYPYPADLAGVKRGRLAENATESGPRADWLGVPGCTLTTGAGT